MANIINVTNASGAIEHFGLLVFTHNSHNANRVSRVFDSRVNGADLPIFYRMSCAYYSGSTASSIKLQGTNAIGNTEDEPSETPSDWVDIAMVSPSAKSRMRNDGETAEKITSGYRFYRFYHFPTSEKCASIGIIGFANK